MERSDQEPTRPPSQKEERCTAPHPAKSFLLSLVAFVIFAVAAFILWYLI